MNVLTTQISHTDWQYKICGSLPFSQNCGAKNQKQPLRWLYEPSKKLSVGNNEVADGLVWIYERGGTSSNTCITQSLYDALEYHLQHPVHIRLTH